MRPFNKTTATLVKPHPFSTLCPTPIGNSPVCILGRALNLEPGRELADFFSFSTSTRYIFPFFPGSRDASDIIVIKKNIFINNILLTVRTFYDCMKNNLLIKNSSINSKYLISHTLLVLFFKNLYF